MPLKLVTISNDEPQLGCPSRSDGTGLSNLEASAVGSVLIYTIILTGKLLRCIGDACVGLCGRCLPPCQTVSHPEIYLERHGHPGILVSTKAERWPAKVSAEVDNEI